MPMIESNLSDYQGNLNAFAFEGAGPIYSPSNVIRTDQQWGVRVEWEMTGPLALWLDAEFRISVFLESIGTGPEYDLAPVVVHTLSVPVSAPHSRNYEAVVKVNPGAVAPGVYKIATCLQLFERSTGNPTPVAGLVEGGLVQIFKPMP